MLGKGERGRVSGRVIHHATPAIVFLDFSRLFPGALARQFRNGARAVVVQGDEWIRPLWEALRAEDAEMPWHAPLYDLAQNLVPHEQLTEALGDVYFFKPGRHSYIARKMEIQSEGETLISTPPSFRTPHGEWKMDQQMRERCWHFSQKIMRALAPPEMDELPVGVRAVVQFLRYHDSTDGQKLLSAMTRNSLGSWARIGYELDRRREEMKGPLGRRGVCDALALLSKIAPLRPGVRGLNHLAGRFDKLSAIPEGFEILSKAHCDSRYFSALSGSRCNLRTEIFVDGAWIPLPINSTDVVVLPGYCSKRAFGITPTLHRVLQAKDSPLPDAATVNATIILGAK